MSIGLGVMNFAGAYVSVRPDILVLLGDRFEMLAAAVSASQTGLIDSLNPGLRGCRSGLPTTPST